MHVLFKHTVCCIKHSELMVQTLPNTPVGGINGVVKLSLGTGVTSVVLRSCSGSSVEVLCIVVAFSVAVVKFPGAIVDIFELGKAVVLEAVYSVDIVELEFWLASV